METWKGVVGLESFYEVSDLGRVRRIFTRNGGVLRPRREPFYLSLRRAPSKRYLQLSLFNGRRRIFPGVHVLVLEAFVGPRPPRAFACHNDGDAFNNVLSNLRWDLPAGNTRDRHAHGTMSINVGSKHPLSKITEETVRIIRSSSLSGSALAKQLNISESSVSMIRSGKRWGSVK